MNFIFSHVYFHKTGEKMQKKNIFMRKKKWEIIKATKLHTSLHNFSCCCGGCCCHFDTRDQVNTRISNATPRHTHEKKQQNAIVGPSFARRRCPFTAKIQQDIIWKQQKNSSTRSLSVKVTLCASSYSAYSESVKLYTCDVIFDCWTGACIN